MNSSSYSDYLHDAISRNSIPELLALYKQSTLTKEGEYTRHVIEEKVPELTKALGYSNDISTFRELVEEHEDRTSPLNEMFISKKRYILVSQTEKIPFSKEEFFTLLKKSRSIRGVKIIFDDNVEAFETLFMCSYIPNKDRFRLTVHQVTNSGNPFAESEAVSMILTYKELLEVEVIEGYFDSLLSTSEVLTAIDVEILESIDYNLSLCELILIYSYQTDYHGVIIFPGVSKKGKYYRTREYTTAYNGRMWKGPIFVPSLRVLLYDNTLTWKYSTCRYYKDDILSEDSVEISINWDDIFEADGEVACLSILSYYIYKSQRDPEDEIEDREFIIDVTNLEDVEDILRLSRDVIQWTYIDNELVVAHCGTDNKSKVCLVTKKPLLLKEIVMNQHKHTIEEEVTAGDFYCYWTTGK